MASSKLKKTLLIILASLFGALVIALIIVNSFLGNILEGKINNALEADGEQNYHVSFDNVRINLLSGNIRITGIQFEPDTSLIRLTKEGMGPSSLFLGVAFCPWVGGQRLEYSISTTDRKKFTLRNGWTAGSSRA